jgi:hypothetical protein
MKMKNLFILAILSIATTAAAQEGTSSVLVNAPESTTPTVASPAVVVTAPQCCDTAKLAKLPPWQVRRLNRIADRQEAREARKCCCDPCECEKADACKCHTKAVVVEARR